MHYQGSMSELLQRLGVVIGISLVLTVLLMVLYQDDTSAQLQDEPATITQAASVSASGHGTP
jgi:hypothetical protein